MSKVMPRIGFLFYWNFICVLAFSQTPILDDLQDQLNNVSVQTPEHVELLHKINTAMMDIDLVKALAYAEESNKISRDIKYKKGVVQSLTDIGQYYYNIGEYTEALKNFSASIEEAGDKSFGDYPAYTFIQIAKISRLRSGFDSAKMYLDRAKEITDDASSSDNIRATLFFNLGYVAQDLSYYSEAKGYFRKSLTIRTQIRDSVVMAECWLRLGVCETRSYKFDSAAYYLGLAYKVASSRNNKLLKLNYYLNVGELSYWQGNYTMAFQFYDHALELIQTYNYNRYVPTILKQIGVIFRVTGDYVKATEHLTRALALSNELGNLQESAQIKTSLGWLYMNQGNYDLALDFANQSLTEMQAIHDEAGKTNCYNLIGFTHMRKKEYSVAIENFQMCYKIRSEIGLVADALSAQYNLGQVYRNMGDYKNALVIHKKVLARSDEMDPRIRVMAFNSTGGILTSLQRPAEAEEYLTTAMEMAKQIKLPIQLRDNYKLRAKLYEQQGDFLNASKYLTEYIDLNDSIFRAENQTRIAQFGALYRLEKKEEEISALNRANELKQGKILLQETTLKMQRNILIFSILGIVLLLVVIYVFIIYYNAKHKANIELSRLNKSISEQAEEIQAQSEEISEANTALMQLNEDLLKSKNELSAQSIELIAANDMITSINRDLETMVEERTVQVKQALVELDTFFYRSSHDFRRPITTFLGLAEVAKITVKDTSALELFEKVSETAKSLDKMLVKLQTISDVGTQQLILKEISLKEMIVNVLNGMMPEIVKRKIEVRHEVCLPPDRAFYSYPVLIKVILENLFENAINFCRPESAYVKIQVREENDFVIIEVEDNGEGIPKEYAHLVFDMYFRASNSSKGNGLGLYSVKKAVEKLDGQITFRTVINEGSVFVVSLPYQFHPNDPGKSVEL